MFLYFFGGRLPVFCSLTAGFLARSYSRKICLFYALLIKILCFLEQTPLMVKVVDAKAFFTQSGIPDVVFSAINEGIYDL